MSRIVHLKLTGNAEKFFNRLGDKGLTERDVVAKALWLLELAVDTNRVALLRKDYQKIEEYPVESILSLHVCQPEQINVSPSTESGPTPTAHGAAS